MDIYLIVGVGGILGSITRYKLGKVIMKKTKSILPMGTFIINITGAFFLGIVSNYQYEKSFYLLLADGFLGAYTTFSTFMYEGFNLLNGKEKLNAVIYITASILVGIIGFLLGTLIKIK